MSDANPRCLVIGCGSIGLRHAGILREKGCAVAGLTHRRDVDFPVFSALSEALDTFGPSLVVVSNPTARHLTMCRELEAAGYAGTVLVEKPLDAVLPSDGFTPSYTAFVAYNLRFHPLVQRVRALLAGRRVFSAQFSVGQYLPSWRPGTDYRASYSAHADQGGGVLRDLSHELDLALWLFGPWQGLTARLGTWGNLGIEAEDTVDILAWTGQCPSLTIHLDYHNLFAQRRICVQADGLSLVADLVAGSLRTADGEEHVVTERNTTYDAQIEALLARDDTTLCTWAEGLRVLDCITAVAEAARDTSWKERV